MPRLSVLEMTPPAQRCYEHGGSGAATAPGSGCTQRLQSDLLHTVTQPSGHAWLLWLLKSERKFSGLTCQLDQLQPLPKMQNILLPPRLLRSSFMCRDSGGAASPDLRKWGAARGEDVTL